MGNETTYQETGVVHVGSTDWLCMAVGRAEMGESKQDDVLRLAKCVKYLLTQLQLEIRTSENEEDELHVDHLKSVKSQALGILHNVTCDLREKENYVKM